MLIDVRSLVAGYRRCLQVVKQGLHFFYDVSPESVAAEAQRDLRRSVRSVDLHTCAVSDTALFMFFESFGELRVFKHPIGLHMVSDVLIEIALCEPLAGRGDGPDVLL